MLNRFLAEMAVFANLSLLVFGQAPVTLLQDTAVRIRIEDSFSARGVRVGQQIEFRVADTVWSANAVAIPRGAVVVGETVPAHKSLFQRTGQIWVKLLYICTPAGEHIPVHILRHGEADLQIDVVRGVVKPGLETMAYVSRDVQLAPMALTALDHPGATGPLRSIASR